MSTPSPELMSHVVEECGLFEGESVYQCLVSYFGEMSSTRTLQEVLLRSFGVHIIALGSYGHLLSMQGLTACYKSVWLLPIFFLFPELSGIQILCKSLQVCTRLIRGHRAPYRYWMGVWLGNHIAVSGTPEPLQSINPSDLRFRRKSYDLVWFGRTTVLLILLVQYIGSAAIWYRGIIHFRQWENLFLQIDLRTHEMTLGGMIAVTNSLLLAILNSGWDYTQPATEPVQLHNTDNVRTRSPEAGNICLGPISAEEMVFAPSSSSKDDKPSAPMLRPFQVLRGIDETFTRKLSKICPAPLQFTLEYAMIAQHTFEVASKIPYFVWRCDRPLSILIHEKRPDREEWDRLFRSRLYANASAITLAIDDTIWSDQEILLRSFQFGIARAMLAIIIRRVMSSSYVKKRLPAMFRLLAFVDKWVLGGRSVVSFPLVLACLVVNIGVRSGRFAGAVRRRSKDGKMGGGLTHWDMMEWAMYRYKDPWYDNMYIL